MTALLALAVALLAMPLVLAACLAVWLVRMAADDGYDSY